MNLFLELIQVAIGSRTELSSTPTMEEWLDIFHTCRQQALLGIAFHGVSILPRHQRPCIDLIFPWSEEAKKIRNNNLQHLKRTEQLLRHLHADGFHAIILKGVANRPYYPESLRDLRTPGDIDVWMWPQNRAAEAESTPDTDHSIDTVIDYCLRLCPNQHVCYLHVDFPVFSDIHVEAHLRPSFLCNPFDNRKLQKWFQELKRQLSIQTDASTSPSQDLVLCELHLFKHLFEEGFGMRQLLDYYFILKGQDNGSAREPDRFAAQLSDSPFHQALNELVLYLFEHGNATLLSTRSSFLLNEVLLGGNFGQYDPRIHHTGGSTRHAWEKLKHNLRLFRQYPSEVLWEPLFRLYHWHWRQQAKKRHKGMGE